MYFTKEEEKRIINILKELNIYGKENVILIDARNDNKISASKKKGGCMHVHRITKCLLQYYRKSDTFNVRLTFLRTWV